jgi:hypothetical protein
MSNVLGDNKQQQVLALGRLEWSPRRIEQATTVRRETASANLKAAGIPVRERGGRPSVWPPKPATTAEVSIDSEQWSTSEGIQRCRSVGRGAAVDAAGRCSSQVTTTSVPAI